MRYVAGVLLLVVAVWWFMRGEPDYPEDWPLPARHFLSNKGGCPDLNAVYTGVNSELSWLLEPNPDYFGRNRPVWMDSRASFAQTADGNTVTIVFSFSPKGLDEFRTRTLKYNTESLGRVTAPSMTLERGKDFECEGGWLYSKYFPQEEAEHGWQRKTLKLGRDRSGGLVAGATVAKNSSIGWGDSARVSLGSRNDTRWYRWPKDDPDTDTTLAKLQSVDLHRYSWKNQNGTAIPIRFTSFYLEPICVRVVESDASGNEWVYVRSGPEQGKSEVRCPQKWGKFEFGQVLRANMDVQTSTSHHYRIEWFPWSARDAKPNVIDVANAQDLPEIAVSR